MSLQQTSKENKMKQRILNQAIYDLSEFIVDRTKTTTFKVSEHTTNSFKAFKAEVVANNGIINVSLEGSETSIYGNKYLNTLARVWHDLIHIEYNLSFNEADETVVARIQKEEVYQDLKFKVGVLRAYYASTLIWLDIMEQVKYYNETGLFVDNQIDFISNKFMEAI